MNTFSIVCLEQKKAPFSKISKLYLVDEYLSKVAKTYHSQQSLWSNYMLAC